MYFALTWSWVFLPPVYIIILGYLLIVIKTTLPHAVICVREISQKDDRLNY